MNSNVRCVPDYFYFTPKSDLHGGVAKGLNVTLRTPPLHEPRRQRSGLQTDTCPATSAGAADLGDERSWIRGADDTPDQIATGIYKAQAGQLHRHIQPGKYLEFSLGHLGLLN
jgi:hypothetical protein